MKIMARSVAFAIVTLLVAVCVWGMWDFNATARGDAFDNLEVANTVFRIRITAYKEMAAFAPGAHYVIQSSNVGSDDWKEIITIRTDEPHPIPRQQFRFVSEQIAYSFLSTYYVVTTDGGNTWSVWDGNKNLPDGRLHNLSPAPKEVELNLDGTGRMVLNPFFKEREKGPDLYTTDYGQHWSIRQ